MRAARPVVAVLMLAQAFLVAISLYQTVVTIAGRARARWRPLPLPVLPESLPRFAVIVCARDEEPVIAGIVMGLLAQEYPRDRFDVIVVAHNCTDATASVAARAGAKVVELQTEVDGKALALNAALDAAGEGWDYLACFDADSRVPTNLLATVSAVIGDDDALQVESVPRLTADWVATGYGLGRRARNVFWWRPREALGLGVTISGSGMVVKPHVLRETLRETKTITEDLEVTARIYLRGSRVAYTSATYVQVDEPGSLGGSLQQRVRWVRGHIGVVRRYWPPLIARAVRGDVRSLDIAVYLIAPTRMLTRTGVTLAMAWSILRLPGSLHPLPVALAFGGEYGVPLAVALRDRLVPFSPRGVALTVEHGLLNLLWYPIGLWALASQKDPAWRRTPRAGDVGSDGVIPAR